MSEQNNNDFKTTTLPDVGDDFLESYRPTGTASLKGKREILLLIGNGVERIMLSENMHCLLGRFPQSKPRGEAIDLSRYDAQNHGVSRIHAQLHIEEDKLYLSDLDSTNGTFISSEQLNPHKPTQLHNGEQIRLGRLTIQVAFK